MAYVLHNNRVQFPKDFFSFVLCTSMVAMTSGEKPPISARCLRVRSNILMSLFVTVILTSSLESDGNTEENTSTTAYTTKNRSTAGYSFSGSSYIYMQPNLIFNLVVQSIRRQKGYNSVQLTLSGIICCSEASFFSRAIAFESQIEVIAT